MTKKKLFNTNEEDQRNFLERLTIAYAPIDEIVMQNAREIAKKEGQNTKQAHSADHKHGEGVKLAVRHLGSI